MSQIPNLSRLFQNQTSKPVSAAPVGARRSSRAYELELANAAAALLRAFNFPTAFGATDPTALSGATTASGQFAALAEKPAGYNAEAVAGAYARFAAGFNMPVGVLERAQGRGGDWHLHGLGATPMSASRTELETADRLATMQLRDLVAQVGVAAKDLAGYLAPRRPGDVDKFATGQTCRTGRDNPTNLTNSDHTTLAIYDILKGNQDKGLNTAGRPGGISFEELAKQLESKYGIKAEVTTVKSKEGDVLKALKFEGGQVFCDGAGDGQADLGDYDFKGAVADITARTGMTRESVAAGAAGFKTGQVDLRSLRTELDAFLKESGEVHKKLDGDFRARWGEPLDQGRLSLPQWLLNLFDEKKAESAKKTEAVDPRELFRQSLSDINGLFALSFVLSAPSPVVG